MEGQEKVPFNEDKKKQLALVLIIVGFIALPFVGMGLNSLIKDYQADAARDNAIKNAKAEEDVRQARINEQAKAEQERKAAADKKAAEDKAAYDKKAAEDKAAYDKKATADQAKSQLEENVRTVKDAYDGVLDRINSINNDRIENDRCTQRHPDGIKAYCGQYPENIASNTLELKFDSEDYNSLAAALGADICKNYGLPAKLNADGSPAA